MPAFTVFANADSGSTTPESLGRFQELMEASGSSVRIEALLEPRLEERIRAAMQRGETIVAAGGDGTIASVAQTLIGSESTLGVLPLGTLNHFSKDLGIGQSLEEAIAVLVAGKTRRIDTARVNDRVFLNNSSLGMYTKLVEYRERLQSRGIGKWFAFLRAIGYIIRRYHRVEVELEINGARISRKTPLLFAGNNEYMLQGLAIGSRAAMDAGVLQLAITNAKRPVQFFISAVRSLWNSHKTASERLSESSLILESPLITMHDEFIDLYRTQAFTICEGRRKRNRSNSFIEVATDGEVQRMQLPLRYCIVPRSLSVLAPVILEQSLSSS